MNKEIEKYLIPDLSNIVMDFVSGTKEYWKNEFNKSLELIKTLTIRMYWDYGNNHKFLFYESLRCNHDDKLWSGYI
jgi:hypothetical protein